MVSLKARTTKWLWCFYVVILSAVRCQPLAQFSHWKVVSNITLGGSLPVAKYRSTRTNLTMVHAMAESPLVNGYFCLATEEFTNDGLPHTLEHLIFLGSEDYPYKEVLDLMANRCLADRTNAWTDTDHTCYTVNTAGSDGFKNILPIYMDHILFPLLREEDFTTEVHHITGSGEDAGVVYSEMQAKENRPGTLLYLELDKLIYPGTNISYHVETGGKLKNLRESTTIKKVRDYHRKYYRPDNMYLIITGNIKKEDLFAALEPVEAKIMSKGNYSIDFDKPFQRDLPELTENVTETYQYPAEDELFGKVYMGWRVPGDLVDNTLKLQALDFLTSYLVSTAVSPMYRSFVNIDNPLATSIAFDIDYKWRSTVLAGFSNVPVERVDDIEPTFYKVIREILETGQEELLSRIRVIIDRAILSRRMNVENSPDVIPDAAIYDLLYSQVDGDIEKLLRMEDESDARKAKEFEPQYWLDLLNRTFLASPRVLLKGVPSPQLNNQLYQKEEERVKAQIETLGPDGLKEAGEKVHRAVESQVLPPNSVLTSVPVADVDTIAYRKHEHYNYTSPSEDFNMTDFPFRFYLDDINSQFVRFYVFLDMAQVPLEDRPYLVILTELWLNSPIKLDNGTVVDLDQVVKNRSRIAQSFYNDLGYKGGTFTPGSQSHLMMFYAEAKMENYLDVVSLMRTALFNVEFSVDRAKSKVSQLLNRIPALRAKAASVTSALYDNIYFNDTSVMHHASFLRQKKVLEKVSDQLETSPGLFISRLHDLRKLLVTPKTSFVHMATNVKQLTQMFGSDASDVWRTFYDSKGSLEPTPKAGMGQRYPIYSEHTSRDSNPEFRHAIVNLGSSESCYMYQGINYNNSDWEIDEVASVRVMLQYLTDRMYDQIRGKGWTYHVSMSSSITEGRIKLTFSRSSSLANAFKAFRDIIEGYYMDGANATAWDPVLLDSAKGALVYSWTETQDSPEDVSSSSVVALLRGAADPFYVPRFVKRLSQVTVEGVRAAANKYLPAFEDVDKTHTAVVCSPGQFETVRTVLRDQYGFNLTEVDDLENSILTN